MAMAPKREPTSAEYQQVLDEERRTKSRDRQTQVEARELRDDPPRASQLYLRAVGGQPKSPCRTAVLQSAGRASADTGDTARAEARLSRFENLQKFREGIPSHARELDFGVAPRHPA